MNKPPFIQGREAFKAGHPASYNPFDPDEPYAPDDYPGRFQLWLDGWRNAKMMREDAKKRLTNAHK